MSAGTDRTGTEVVVTGVGVAAPNGLTVEQFWTACLEGRSGIGPVDGLVPDRYATVLGGRIRGFDPEEHLPGRLLPQTDRVTQLALYAAEKALADAGLDPQTLGRYDVGVALSNAGGGFEFTHREFRKLWTQGRSYVSVYESFAWFYACNTGQISIRHGLRGPGSALVGEQAGGLDAIGYARRSVRRGTPAVITGGADSALDPWGWVSQLSTGRVSPVADPARAYLPFDAAASGYLPGEGGAVLVLEDAQEADRRGAANRYGRVAGYAATFDPPPDSPRPRGLRRAAELALADAGLTAADIDVVFADAAGTRGQDRAEVEVIGGLFGPFGIPVCAPKAYTGRLYSGGGPLDVVAALLAIRDGVLPPAPAATTVPEEYALDLVTGRPRSVPARRALVLARGAGGFNAAVVVTAAPSAGSASGPGPTRAANPTDAPGLPVR